MLESSKARDSVCGRVGEGKGSFDLLLSIWAVLREIFYACFFPPPPCPAQFAGRFAVVLWCLHVSVIVSQIAVAQRLGGILFPVKGWGEIWNFRTLCGIRAVFFSLRDDQELIQTISPFFMPLNRPNARDTPS